MLATIKNYYSDDEEADEQPCIVRFRSGEIEVAYDYGGETRIWKGRESGGGHYRLKCPEIRGVATLHSFNDGHKRFEGSWTEVENGYLAEGMWQIEVED